MATLTKGAQPAALLTRRALDGRQLLNATDERLRAVLGTALDIQQVDTALAIIGRWRAWCTACGVLLAADGWDDERLEYSFASPSGITITTSQTTTTGQAGPSGGARASTNHRN